MQVGYSCSPPYVVPDPNADVICPLIDSLGSPNRSQSERADTGRWDSSVVKTTRTPYPGQGQRQVQ